MKLRDIIRTQGGAGLKRDLQVQKRKNRSKENRELDPEGGADNKTPDREVSMDPDPSLEPESLPHF